MGPNDILTKALTAEAAITKNNVVKLGATDDSVAPATAATDLAIGVAMNDALIGERVDVQVMGIETWRKLSRNDKILAAVKGTLSPQAIKTPGGVAKPQVNQAELADYLGLDAVLVSRARINTAKKGQAASYSRVWDGTNAGKGGAALLRVGVLMLSTASGRLPRVLTQSSDTVSEAGQRVAEEIVSGGRNPVALVFALDSFTRKEGDQIEDRYSDLYVFVGVANRRGGIESRCGDGSTIGIHRAMEFVENTINRGVPGVQDPENLRIAAKVDQPEGDIVFEQAGLYVGFVRFRVRAVPI